MRLIMLKRKTLASQALLHLAIAFAFLFVSSQTQTCPANGIEAGVETLPRPLNATQDEHYLLTGKGVINCKGVIREWVFHTNENCSSGAATIWFEIWRPVWPGNLVYELVGKNEFSSADCISPTANNVTFGIAPVDRIPVEPGYTIGWYQNANALQISYDIVNDTNSFYHSNINASQTSFGVQLTFESKTELRDFSLKVTVMQGEYPTLDNLPSSVTVNETAAPSTVVFTVVASHISNYQYSTAVPLSFSLSPTSAPFYLTNSSNGRAQVATIGALDYGTLNVYQLSITVTGLGLSTTEVLTVNVTDVNEPHNITNLPTNVNVAAASTLTGDQVFLVSISDLDVNSPVPVRFFFQNWTSPDTNMDIPPFSINPDTGSVEASVNLSNWYLQHPQNSPPYPSSIQYDLTILATDGVNSDREDLTVTITNVKQPPAYLNLPETIEVDENIPGNTVIYQVLVVKMTDPILRFRLTTASTPFCINELSGVISLCSYAKLDYCNTSAYNVNVTAADSAMSSTSVLTVNLRKVNNAPTFSPPIYSGSVDENCPTNPSGSCDPVVPVTSINVNDPDLLCSSNAIDSHNCFVMPGPASRFFDIYNCSTVRNILPIDVDSNPVYEDIILLIGVQDSGNLTAYAVVNVSVININEHSPNFTQYVYTGSVQENANGGTSVLSVEATDGDHGINGQLFYSISDSDPWFLYFQVDPQSGFLTTKQPLDFENLLMPSPLILTVWATDKGIYSRNDSAFVRIHIIDMNDVRPVINCSNRPSDEPYPLLPCFYNFDLKHDAVLSSNVSDLLLFADDVDPQPNVISFNQLVKDEHFSVDGSNGLVTVAMAVEPYAKYVLYVYAEDNGSPRLKSRIMYIRIDTYRPVEHWIDMTIRPKTVPFDEDAFLAALRNVTFPWFVKMVAVTNYNPNVQKDIVVTVYALTDYSTYFPENITNQKIFVHRDELLKKLRKNIYGDPDDVLHSPPFEGSGTVVKVMPSYVNWWIDTVEGIATIVCLSAIATILAAVLAVALCKRYQALCFKPTRANPLTIGGASKPAKLQSSTQENVRHRSASRRRDSVMTVHSAIVSKDL